MDADSQQIEMAAHAALPAINKTFERRAMQVIR
jgi:hypothetical protein